MDALHDFFERVYVINLKRRPDRLRTCLARLQRHGWPFKPPQVYAAIDGDKVGVPPEFTQGGGAYGCRMSHLRILQDCLMDDVSSVLILEDEADITEGFSERVRAFLEKVPSDWQGIMLGGQHHAPPIPTGIPGVVRVRYCQRTHAYAARRDYMQALQRRWANATVHIDWLMRDWQHQHIVYAPESWLIGQAGGRSDIRGAEKPMEWWNSQAQPPGPVAVALVTRDVLDAMLPLGFHPGMERDADGIDVTLKRCLADGTAPQHRIEGLRRWLGWIQAESVGGLLPTVWHPQATTELVRQAWAGPVYEVRGESAEEAFGCLPAEVQERMRRRASLRTSPIILLSCPRAMVEQLHAHGFHPGYWRDRQTGIDKGLERIFAEVPQERRIEELRKWCDFLCREGDRDGLIVVARHSQLNAAMLTAATTRPVVEIRAESIEELKRAVVGAT
ncbi:glycosyltransferase family 25 protein [Thermopirellula anaerolimosa]